MTALALAQTEEISKFFPQSFGRSGGKLLAPSARAAVQKPFFITASYLFCSGVSGSQPRIAPMPPLFSRRAGMSRSLLKSEQRASLVERLCCPRGIGKIRAG